MAAMWMCEEHVGSSVMVWYGYSNQCPACELQTRVDAAEKEAESLKSEVDLLKDEVAEAKEQLEEEKAREK